MGAFDPVSWDVVEEAVGPPAQEITRYVDRMEDEVYGQTPYAAVKAIHDALDADDVERTVPGLGDPFIAAYLLEQRGIITQTEGDTDAEYRSIVDRRPSPARLRELFWDRERTLWWVGVLTGVHHRLSPIGATRLISR